MDKLLQFLREWIINYLKHKDILTKEIKNIKQTEHGFIVNYNEKTQSFVIKPIITSFEDIELKENLSLIVLNNEKNLEILIENWNKLIKIKSLNIYFINPFSNTDKKWIINPYTHNKICDESSLKSGLKTMFSMVESTDEEKANSLVK